jgi:hypothetical protein
MDFNSSSKTSAKCPSSNRLLAIDGSRFPQIKKQHAILREYQEEVYGERRAFILSVITRWGTQFHLVQSVLKNKDALIKWALDKRAKMGEVRTTIFDSGFWNKLEDLSRVLKPPHEQQKISERNNSTLDEVVPRWNTILQEIEALVALIPQLRDFIDSRLKPRRSKQLRAVHTVAMFLSPVNRAKTITPEVDTAIASFMFKRCETKEVQAQVHKSFHAFKGGRDGFQNGLVAWIHKNDPLAFWQTFESHATHRELARIAITIFETPANSVASERAFSCMNLITTAIRNRLKAEKATKLTYIHMN